MNLHSRIRRLEAAAATHENDGDFPRNSELVARLETHCEFEQLARRHLQLAYHQATYGDAMNELAATWTRIDEIVAEMSTVAR